MPDKQVAAPDSTAVRVALWRALHVEVDPPPHVFEDAVGLKLAAPDEAWRSRPDMSPFTRPFRASIVARARFIEDLVAEHVARGVTQYVILGAGLDTFAQRRAALASRMLVFEIDRPGPQAWKRQRLINLGFGIPEWLRLVPVNFEAGDAWWDRLAASGFDSAQPAIVTSTGVSMYLTRNAIAAMLRHGRGARPGLHAGHVVPASDRAGGSRPALRDRESGGGGPGQWHALHQLLHADGDACAGPRRRVQGRPARLGGHAGPALFRGQDGWPPSAEQRRGTAGGDDLE
jgi:methyltransferase (TIGR00027 family)